MFSVVFTLEHFSQPTAICSSTAKVGKLLDLASAGQSEMVVVVDRRGYPLGAISWRQLLDQFLNSWQKSANLPLLEPVINLKSIILPMTILSAKMTLNEFREWRESHPESLGCTLYGLVDEKNKFRGLLDCQRLSLLGDSSSLGGRESFLTELLDQLPMPCLIGRGSGTIVYENQPWQEHIASSFSQDLEISLVGASKSPCRGAIPQGIEKSQSQYDQASLALISLLQNSRNSLIPKSLPLKLESDFTKNERVWELVKIPLSSEDESEPTWLMMAIDVTEQRQCSQELAGKNADLIHLNRLKDEFLACISHELKSPLTAVIGLSTLLKEGKIGELNERQTRYAELIYHSGRELMALVNDILDLTRLETGQLKLTPTLVRIDNVCQRAYQNALEKYKAKGSPLIPFTLSIAPNLEKVIADEMRLQQMLVHLLDNAMKFSPEGGEIGIKVNLWSDWLAFTVWDTGIGIPEEFQPLIFEKFQQLESPLTRQFEGAGLGLVLTQRLAKAHGGDISFISQVGIGSQFTILLPPHPFSESVHPQPEKADCSSHPLILIVEAIPKAVNHLCDQLNQLGYPVVVARTGTEAIEKARQLHPHRIFLSPLLPLLSGWDVLTLLKSDVRTAALRVIITASGENQFRSEQGGADGFLSLPLELERLQAILADFQPIPAQEFTKLTVLQLCRPDKSQPKLSSTVSSSLNLLLGSQLSRLNCRLLEADSLEQGEMIASVWDVDAVILDGSMEQDSLEYLHSLSRCENLANLPLITLDQTLTEFANQISNLSIFPCLLPPTESNIEQLIQVIQIAAQSHH